MWQVWTVQCFIVLFDIQAGGSTIQCDITCDRNMTGKLEQYYYEEYFCHGQVAKQVAIVIHMN